MASKPNIVSLVNAGTIQVDKTLQGNTSYNISRIDHFEALVDLKSQSNSNKLTR